MQGKIVIQERFKHAVMNRPRKAALGNSEPPFSLPVGAAQPRRGSCKGSDPVPGGGRSPLKPPGSLPPSFCSSDARRARLPQAALTQAALTRGQRRAARSLLGPGPSWEMRHLRRAGLLSHDRYRYRYIPHLFERTFKMEIYRHV